MKAIDGKIRDFVIKQQINKVAAIKPRNAIIYTRVSDPKQLKNCSLETQVEACVKFCEDHDIQILERFGGEAERGEADVRKEFDRMLKFIDKNHTQISFVVIYHLDRFSRKGASAVGLIGEMKAKYKINVVGTNLPVDDSVYADVLKSMLLLFAKVDNHIRTEKCVNGMKHRLKRGLWMGSIPIGYEIDIVAGKRCLKINSKGELIRKAFEWKVEDMSSVKILAKLRDLGLDIPKQTLSRIFRNVFYAGYIQNSLILNEIIVGVHPPIVDDDTFIRVNEILNKNQLSNRQKKKNERYALSSFTRLPDSNVSFVGYQTINKYGQVYEYYKANRTGAKVNRPKDYMEQLFADFIDHYSIAPTIKGQLREELTVAFEQYNITTQKDRNLISSKLDDLNDSIDKLMEDCYVNKIIPIEHFKQLHSKRIEEKRMLNEQLKKHDFELSNFDEFYDISRKICENLHDLWLDSDIEGRKKVQILVFPEGVWFDPEIEDYRTPRVNSCIELISSEPGGYKDGKNENDPPVGESSHKAVWTGLEPATSCVTGRHSNQLNYQTFLLLPTRVVQKGVQR